MKKEFNLEIGSCKRTLPLITCPNVSYYSFNMLGDTQLNREAAKVLSKKIIKDADVLVTIESKAIALTHCLAEELKHTKYVIIRKSKKSYMKNEISVSGNTIISGSSNYFLDGEDIKYLKDKKIVVVDDVISTCGTISAVKRLLDKAGIEIKQYACVLCEGKMISSFEDKEVVSCGFIPLLEGEND